MQGRKLFFWRLQDGRCYLRACEGCKRADGKMGRRGPRRATWEHVLPRSQGGALAFNSLLACSECNGKKRSQMPSLEHGEWAQRLGMIWHRYSFAKQAERGVHLDAWLRENAALHHRVRGEPSERERAA